MRNIFTLAALIAASFSISVFGPIEAQVEPTILRPISNLELPSGLGGVFKRSPSSNDLILIPLPPDFFSNNKAKRSDDFTGLSPHDNAILLFGAPTDVPDAIVLAKLQLQGNDNMPIVAMENFQHITSSVECNDDDGKMSMTFVSSDAFDAAKKAWEWLNKDLKNEFLLVANHPGCGADEQRVPYRVSQVEYAGLTATFSVKLLPWNGVHHNMDLSWGSYKYPTSTVQRLRLHRRWNPFSGSDWKDLGNKIKNEAKDAGKDLKNAAQKVKETAEKVQDAVEQEAKKVTKEAKEIVEKVKDTVKSSVEATKDAMDVDKTKSMTLKFSKSTGAEPKNIWSGPDVVVDCIDCSLTGSVDFSGRVKIENGTKVQELSFTFNPEEIKARFELAVKIPRGQTITSWSQSTQLFGLSMGGIVIPEILEFGPTVDFEIGASLSATVAASFNLGADIVVPRSAVVKADLIKKSVEGSGWDAMTFSPIGPKLQSASGGINAEFHAQPAFKIGFSILGDMVGFGAEVKVKAPQLAAKGNVVADEAGACKGKENEGTMGLQFTGNIGAAVLLTVGDDRNVNEMKSLWNKEIWKVEKGLWDVCLPLGGGGNGTAVSPNGMSGVGKRRRFARRHVHAHLHGRGKMFS